VRRVRAHRRHHHVTPHPGPYRRVREEHGGTPVHGVLAGRAAARTRACRENGGIGALQMCGDLLDRGRLQIAQDRLGAGRPQIVPVLGSADDARDLVTARGEQALQPQRDLTMTSSDDNAHVFDRTPGH
jgi:hypothetical protein